MEAGRGDDQVGFQKLARFQLNAGLGEGLDVARDNRGLPGRDRLQEVAVRYEGDALPPRPVARREVPIDRIVRAEIGAHAGEQFLLYLFWLGERALGEDGLLVENLAPDDL